MVETEVHAGVVSGTKDGRSVSSTEVSLGGSMVVLISWIPLPLLRDASGARWRGGVVQLVAYLYKDVAQKVESPPLLRLEGLPVGSLETKAPDEIVRAGGGELVAGFQYLLAEGRGRKRGEISL